MPRPSKKKKDKGASSSGSSVGVRNLNFHVRLENNLGRAILSERNMDLNNLLRAEVPQMVDAMGWRQLVTTTYRINERLVRKFYAAMVHTEFDKGTLVKVRGVDVGFSAQDINSYYGTQNYGDLDTGVPKLAIFMRYNLELAQDLCMPHVMKSWDDGDNQLLQHDLELIWAFWEAEDAAEEDPGAVPVGDHRPVWVDELFQRQGEMETKQTALEKAMTDLTKAIQDSYLSASER
ncbi:hypothetical protein LWI28_020764 [Acer negundo]|uniref:Uncharacterized protein n=1 Tax=Acer negundo TaxID=4023 RepID=A0AAD5IG74_ACENE|nr:hypothetical protein LWI28_020764 [Acer negundo]